MSELLDLLLGAGSLGDLVHVEGHHLAWGPAVALCESVPDLDAPKTGGKVHRHVPVTLLKAVMLSNVVQVIWEDERVVLSIFVLVTRQNLPSDGDITSKRAFLVDVVALDGLLGCLEAQTDVFVVLQELLLASFSKQDPLLILEDDWLCLVGMPSLNVCHLPGRLKKGSAKYFCPQFTDEESETR